MAKSRKRKEAEAEALRRRQRAADLAFMQPTTQSMIEWHAEAVKESGNNAPAIYAYEAEACEAFRVWYSNSGLDALQLSKALGVEKRTACKRIERPETIKAREALSLQRYLDVEHPGAHGRFIDTVLNLDAGGARTRAGLPRACGFLVSQAIEKLQPEQALRYERLFLAMIEADVLGDVGEFTEPQ